MLVAVFHQKRRNTKIKHHEKQVKALSVWELWQFLVDWLLVSTSSHPMNRLLWSSCNGTNWSLLNTVFKLLPDLDSKFSASKGQYKSITIHGSCMLTYAIRIRNQKRTHPATRKTKHVFVYKPSMSPYFTMFFLGPWWFPKYLSPRKPPSSHSILYLRSISGILGFLRQFPHVSYVWWIRILTMKNTTTIIAITCNNMVELPHIESQPRINKPWLINFGGSPK